MRNARELLTCGLALAVLAGVAPAQQTVHVDGACGDDAWTGQSAVCQAPDGPKRTIEAGIAAAGVGGIVLVAPGVYNGAGNTQTDLYGAALTLRAVEGPESTIVDGAGRSWWLDIDSSDILIDGFTVRNFTKVSTPVQTTMSPDDMVIIRNCRFMDNVGLYGGAIHWSHHGSGGAMSVSNCVFARNHGLAGAIMDLGNSTLDVVNCTFVDGHGNGGVAAVDSVYGRIFNCVIRGDGDKLRRGTAGNNNIEGPLGADVVDAGGNIDADPLFADPGADDYRLLAGSPCIDAGDNTKVPDWLTTDIAGLPRFADDPATADTGVGPPPVVDMGAHEFQAGGCYADFTGDGVLDLFDFLAFVNAFNAHEDRADCDGNGSFDLFDFLCFVNAFNAEC